MGSADILLHPVRLRILQAFLGREELTTGQLRELVDDVSTATLYRQVNALLEAEVIEVTSERAVRGAVERTMRVRPSRLHVDGDKARTMDVDEHRRAFLMFVAGLLADYDRYLDQPGFDLERDLVGYRQAALVATDDELVEFLGRLGELAAPLLDRPATGGRRRRLLSTVLMPAAELDQERAGE